MKFSSFFIPCYLSSSVWILPVDHFLLVLIRNDLWIHFVLFLINQFFLNLQQSSPWVPDDWELFLSCYRQWIPFAWQCPPSIEEFPVESVQSIIFEFCCMNQNQFWLLQILIRNWYFFSDERIFTVLVCFWSRWFSVAFLW